jgi:hypothetical protein
MEVVYITRIWEEPASDSHPFIETLILLKLKMQRGYAYNFWE